MIGKLSRIVYCSVLALGLFHARARADVITDLGTVPFGTTSKGFAINNSGVATGESQTFFGAGRAFRSNSTSSLTDLGALPGGFSSRGLGIGASGDVVGRSQVMTSRGLQTHAFRSEAEGVGLTDLGTLTGGSFSEARAISGAGLVVGVSNNGSGAMRAVSWSSNEQATDLGSFTSTGNSEAFAVNDAGQATGRAELLSGVSHAFRYTPSPDSITPPEFRDLGGLSEGGSSAGMAIDRMGRVAGYADAPGGFIHAFLWEEAGGMIDLHGKQFLGSSFALGMNDSGMVVGRLELLSGGTRAFFWSKSTGMIDLNTLVEPGSGWFLSSATGINSRGQIVGFGTHNGQQRGFLLTRGDGDGGGDTLTTPEPGSIVLAGLGAAMLLLARQRRR